MPRLWNETIDAHRQAVHEAILNATAELVRVHGLLSVTMSKIAETTGIGRATLYKYFPDVEAILHTWHQRQVESHLQQLADIRDRVADPRERLDAVLHAYARISQERSSHDRPGHQLAAILHQGPQLAQAQQQVQDLIKDLLIEVAASGDLRDDVAPDELAAFCVHALSAAASLRSEAAVRRLVTVTITGLRPSS
ncbi:TetR/AcrR family transcriptional regulator [Saccharothrix texasensis]|uniref:TetR family transcriptional regulator n=1 Tax=Saccharothrix texasensis TaxID=103734 RepID=A0A3N1H413_9PSEU|nr:TetR/AcrR family transcriptional regulator [Saccharothrix texasensis]ROP37245.1 TetR family transcriptional regulator [Saccharothrix texasensis]